MRRAIVLGGTGFIGSFLVAQLRREQVDIISLGRRPLEPPGRKGRHIVLDAYEAEAALEQLVADIQPDSIIDLLGNRDQDHIAHLRIVHRLITVLASRGLDTTLVLTGSAAEYGHPAKLPVYETHPLRPATGYGFAKALQTWMAQALSAQTGCRVVVARLFNVVGPGQSDAFVAGAIVRQAVQMAAGARSVVEIGRTDSARDFIDARDVARALATLARRGQGGEAYNICSGRAVTVEEILHKVGRLCGLPAAFYAVRRERVSDDVAAVYGDSGKLGAATGWIPEISLDRSLADMIAFERSARRPPVPAS